MTTTQPRQRALPHINVALDAMKQYGGRFARHLAEAWQCADSDNQRRLREAFPELLADYHRIAADRAAAAAVSP